MRPPFSVVFTGPSSGFHVILVEARSPLPRRPAHLMSFPDRLAATAGGNVDRWLPNPDLFVGHLNQGISIINKAQWIRRSKVQSLDVRHFIVHHSGCTKAFPLTWSTLPIHFPLTETDCQDWEVYPGRLSQEDLRQQYNNVRIRYALWSKVLITELPGIEETGLFT